MSTTVRLNADQEEIRQVARGFLESRFPSDRVRELMATPEGFSEQSWKEISELGWAGIALPEAAGGAGYSFVERCILLEEMGRALYPEPYLSSAVLAADAVLLGAEGQLAEEILAALAAGERRATLVAAGDLLGGTRPAGAVVATAAADAHTLNGDGGLVVDGASAEVLVVCAALGDGLGLFAVEAAAEGLERTAAPTIDATRKTARVAFDGTPARRLDAGGEIAAAIALALDRGAVSLAAEMVGGARRSIEMTVAYMEERQQFGGPIGRFQALKHRLADLHVAVDAAREGVYSAADAIASGDAGQVPMAAAAAKAAACRAYVRTTAEAVQLHGGIGFTEEHDIGLYYKRALAGAPMLGGSEDELERIAVGLGV